MHNPSHKKLTLSLTGLGLLVCLLLCLGSEKALADSRIACNGPGTGDVAAYIDLGNMAPDETFETNMYADCTVKMNFTYGTSLGHTQSLQVGGGNKANSTNLFHSNTGKNVPLQELGTVGTVCLPLTCGVAMWPWQTFSYNVKVTGSAGDKYGTYTQAVTLNYTTLDNFHYTGYLQTYLITYKVIKPPCNLASNSTLNLPFGTLSSNDFTTSQQIADIKIICPSSTQAIASLTSAQSSPGAAGTTYTTLPQLLMVATWGDTNTPVNFNVDRAFAFSTGMNTIKLGFRPKLVSPDATPSGNFSSQYTLNITYL